MKHFIVYNEFGQIMASGFSANPEIMEDDQFKVMITDQTYEPTEYYLSENGIEKMPPKPSDKYRFNYTTHTWEEDSSLYVLEARRLRAELLSESDWTQLPDVPLSTKEKWKIYRQELRDITSQEGFPESVNWPTKPS